MGCQRRFLGGNGYVVHVHADGGASRLVFQDRVAVYVVHHGLERGGRVRQPEEHDCWFIESSSSLECGLPLVTVLDSHIVVAPADVQFRIDECSPQILYERQDEWLWVLITHRPPID